MGKNTKDLSLEALLKNKGLAQIFEAKDKGNALRAEKIGDANGIQYAILDGGNEYENIGDIKDTNAKFILPLNFPDAYDVSNPFQADYVSLKDMRRWNQAPSNSKGFGRKRRSVFIYLVRFEIGLKIQGEIDESQNTDSQKQRP